MNPDISIPAPYFSTQYRRKDGKWRTINEDIGFDREGFFQTVLKPLGEGERVKLSMQHAKTGRVVFSRVYMHAASKHPPSALSIITGLSPALDTSETMPGLHRSGIQYKAPFRRVNTIDMKRYRLCPEDYVVVTDAEYKALSQMYPPISVAPSAMIGGTLAREIRHDADGVFTVSGFRPLRQVTKNEHGLQEVEWIIRIC